jgi:uncharacterized protein
LTPDNPWRPFCSERCKNVDFGDWLGERHRIAGDDSGTDPEPDPAKD